MPAANKPGDGISQRFTGQERDFETVAQLDFFQARYYGGVLGRFTSPDPMNAGADLTNPQSWNGYSYVQNNPLGLVDPTGEFPSFSDIWGGISSTFSSVNKAISNFLNPPCGQDFCVVGLGHTDVSAEGAANVGGLLSPTYTATGYGKVDVPTVSTPPKTQTCPSVPTHPQNSDVNKNILQAQIVSTVSLLGGPLVQASVSLGWFAGKELPNKAWDYKTQGQQFDAFGNFNYGAVGAALDIPSYVLQAAGGALSTVVGTNNRKYGSWYQPPLYGHPPAKSAAISAGIAYYQNGCSF